MTPFGLRIRELRAQKKVTQKEMAETLGVSAAYLSALEKGRRGAPSWQFVQRIIGYFNIIWDDAEELQKLAVTSHPKVIVDTTNLSVEATELANLVARKIGKLDRQDLKEISHDIQVRVNRKR
ncbi:MAG: helix-turn-helix transcriptional regulator [Salaquimonas sp.]